jgi:serine/threonine protein kinase
VKSLGWYDDNHNIYITMEYLPYGDLQNHLSSPLHEAEGQNIILQILQGLSFMHESGFAHRDLKPAVSLFIFTDSLLVATDISMDKEYTSCAEGPGLVGQNCGLWHQ